MGTSTSGILQAELAYRRRDPGNGALPDDFVYATTQNSFSVADFVQRLGLAGPAASVSSACSSSAKVFGSAARMIESGLIDAAVVGGVDSLCLTTLYGFSSLQLTSTRPCRPFDRDRDGMSIGEAAAFFLVERPPAEPSPDAILLLGVGESSDAYHMSSPHPDGLGARMAMEQALAGAAGSAPNRLHQPARYRNAQQRPGRGPRRACALRRCHALQFDQGAVGHTLGAAGGVEAAISALALRHGFMPGGRKPGNSIPRCRLLPAAQRRASAVAGTQQFVRLRRHQLQPHTGSRGCVIGGA